MEYNPALLGLECFSCNERFDPKTTYHYCPTCGGVLDPVYEFDAIDVNRRDFETRRYDTMWRYDELLPFSREDAVTLGEGATSIVPCPTLAAELGVQNVYIKDEGGNPTGSFKDRGQTLAITAAVAHGATDIVLGSAGNAGQSAAAYAARAGINSHVFLPERAGFIKKAMVNVHGGDLTVHSGRYADTGAIVAEANEEHPDWYSTNAFETPYRHEGKKTMGYEIIEQLDWQVPDHIIYPTGGGVGLIGIHKAAKEFRELGLTTELPALYAAQSTGCAPIVNAWENGLEEHQLWETPDTICGGIEIPDPGMSPYMLDALDESGGGAVATSDSAILDSANTVAREEGVEMAATAAAAASGAWELAQSGEFDSTDTIVIMNTATGNKTADVLRSHLMSQGV